MVGCQECGSHAIFIGKIQISLSGLFQKFQVAITSSLVVASGHFFCSPKPGQIALSKRAGCWWSSLPTKLVNQWQGRVSLQDKAHFSFPPWKAARKVHGAELGPFLSGMAMTSSIKACCVSLECCKAHLISLCPLASLECNIGHLGTECTKQFPNNSELV